MRLRVKGEAANCYFFFKVQYHGRLTERKSIEDLGVLSYCHIDNMTIHPKVPLKLLIKFKSCHPSLETLLTFESHFVLDYYSKHDMLESCQAQSIYA